MQRDEVAQAQQAIALHRPQIARGQDSRQPAPTGAIGGIGDDVRRTIGEDQTGADRQREAEGRQGGTQPSGFGAFQRVIGAHDACDGIAVGDADAGMAERYRLRDHVLGMAGTVEERVIGRGDQLDEPAHGAMAPPAPSTPSSRPWSVAH